MKRKIIRIDESKCDGCGECVPNCAEGALQIIDGKARLISDLFCDGLGACIGHCPQQAITVEEREAEPYNEYTVMEKNIFPAGKNTIISHLNHLESHGAADYLAQALDFLKKKGIPDPRTETGNRNSPQKPLPGSGTSCPGMAYFQLNNASAPDSEASSVPARSELRAWPVQLHLANPQSPAFKKADILLAADCSAFASANFHQQFLKGKTLVIACPKLDINLESYIEKISLLIEKAEINTITVLHMEVPCCGGLLTLIRKAREKTARKVPVKDIMLSIKGDVISEQWV